jgi:hypothetical protein
MVSCGLLLRERCGCPSGLAESGAVPCDAMDGGCGELPSTLCAPSAPPSREARIAYFEPILSWFPLVEPILYCTPCLRDILFQVPGIATPNLGGPAAGRRRSDRRSAGRCAPSAAPPPPLTTLESAPYSTAPSERHQGWRRRRSVERVSHLQGKLMGS